MSIARVKDNLKQIRDSSYYLSAQFPNKLHTNSDLTLAEIASVHINGAKIKHPGGTEYGYKNEKDLKKNRVRFVKTGSGYKVLGKTGAHTIEIQSRPFIQNSWLIHSQEFWNIVVSEIAKNIDSQVFDFELILSKAAFGFQQATKASLKQGQLSLAPLKSRKGQPLSDTGELGNSLIIKVNKV